MNVSDRYEEKWPPVSIFYAYAHEDEKLREELEKQMSGLRREGLISEWHDRQIFPGEIWDGAINEHLNSAQIILLLISPDFLYSDYCYSTEMQRALKRNEIGEAYAVPIILRPTDWRGTPLGQLQALPRDAKPITTWKDQGEALLNVVEGIRKIVKQLRSLTPDEQPPVRGPRRALKDRSRQERLRRVKNYVTQFLKQALGDTSAFMHLGLSARPDAVELSRILVYQDKTELLEAEISKVYEQAKGELLILGEPGSGKTTLLYKLAEDLLARASADETYPVPVILSLASWTHKRLPLAKWLAEELGVCYKVPMKVSQAWLEHDRLILLLDGLDELDPEHRSTCIQAINVYRQEHGQASLVICSRSAEYFGQVERIQLGSAVRIQPLTLDQVYTYLQEAGESMSALGMALQSDEALRELATTPLMLHLLMIAYHGVSVHEVADGSSLQEKRKRVFAHYVERMQAPQRGTQENYTLQQTQMWLAWLAKQLTVHNQAELYLDRLQPDWLGAGSRWHRLFRPLSWLGVILASGMLSAVFYGLIGGTISLLSAGRSGFIGLFVIGLFGGLTGGLTNRVREDIRPAEIVSWSWHDFWHSLTHSGIVAGCLAGLVATILLSFFVLQGYWEAALQASVPLAVIFGLLYQAVNTLPPTPPRQGSGSRVRSWLTQGLVDSFTVGLVVFLLLSLAGYFLNLADYFTFGHSLSHNTIQTSALSVAVFFGLSSLFVTLEPPREQEQSTSERLSLWKKLLLGVGIGCGFAVALFLGPVIGFVAGVFTALMGGSDQDVGLWLFRISFIAVTFFSFLSLLVTLDPSRKRAQGISVRVSLQSKLRIGIGFGLVVALLANLLTKDVFTVGFIIITLIGFLRLLVALDPSQRQEQGISAHSSLSNKLRIGVGCGFAGVLVASLMTGNGIALALSVVALFSYLSLLNKLDPSQRQVQSTSARLSLQRKLRIGIGFGLAGTLPICLFAGVFICYVIAVFGGLPQGLSTGGALGSVGALLCWLPLSIFFGLKNKQPREESVLHQVLITWIEMWRLALQSNVLRYGFTFSLLGAVFFGVGYYLQYGSIQAATVIWNFGEAGFIIGGTARIILNGFVTQMRENEVISQPNQGILYSWKNGIRFGIIFAIIGYGLELAFGVATSTNAAQYGGLLIFDGLIFAIYFGVCGWLFNGGLACVQYMVLRWLLWHEGITPWAYVRFLDYATGRHLLYKVGGSYMFIHRFLQEYFASLDTSTSALNVSKLATTVVLLDSSVPTIAPVPSAPYSNVNLCSKCRSELPPNSHYCSNCGAEVLP